MKDSWGPLKALAVASIVNGIGDVVLCMFLGYGIAGAAWATMASQVCFFLFMLMCLLSLHFCTVHTTSIRSHVSPIWFLDYCSLYDDRSTE